MRIYERIWAIEKLCFGLTGFRLSCFHLSTIGLDRQKTSRGFSATETRARIGRHEQLRHDIVTTRQETTEFAFGGTRQRIRTGNFDAENGKYSGISRRRRISKVRLFVTDIEQRRGPTKISPPKNPFLVFRQPHLESLVDEPTSHCIIIFD